eukprot:1144571-Amphidinium_carterae.1
MGESQVFGVDSLGPIHLSTAWIGEKEKIKEKSKEEAAEAEVAGGLKMGAKSLCVPLESKYHEAFAVIRAAKYYGLSAPLM